MTNGTLPDDITTETATQWVVPDEPRPERLEPIMQTLGVEPRLAAMLHGRGFNQPDRLKLLNPSLQRSPLPNADEAAERIAYALKTGERILIHGDYDADGITGSAVLTRGLGDLDGHVEAFLPNRLTHGYGVSESMVDEHASRADLFVTVDCGITNHEAVRMLRERGVDVIVTDHHTPGQAMPDALVVHPRHDNPTAHAEIGELTGAGVAYHLLWAVHDRLNMPPPDAYADLAAIGTVADVAPILGENRALTQAGLARMETSPWPGIRALLDVAGHQGTITAENIAFTLAPRLNASGRLGQPEVGLNLLLADDPQEAARLAQTLDRLNHERKEQQDAMFQQALGEVQPDDPAIVIANDDWHPGIMGIVASKLVDRFYKPTFVIARGQGSVRGIEGVSAVDALHAASEHLKRYGGHVGAAGFAIDPSRIPDFRAAIHAHHAALPAVKQTVHIDAWLAPSELTHELVDAVDALEPYGEGFRPPTFALHGRLTNVRAVGRDGAHLQMRIDDTKGVAFGRGDLAARLTQGEQVHVAAAITRNTFRGRTTVEFRALDVRPAGRANSPTEAPAGRVQRTEVNTPGATDGLPVGTTIRTLHEPAVTLFSSTETVSVSLSQEAKANLLATLATLPTVATVRDAIRAQRNGSGTLDRVHTTILEELDLLEDGRIKRGVKRQPYDSATLRASELQRYRFMRYVHAFERADDATFEQTVRALFGADDHPG